MKDTENAANVLIKKAQKAEKSQTRESAIHILVSVNPAGALGLV